MTVWVTALLIGSTSWRSRNTQAVGGVPVRLRVQLGLASLTLWPRRKLTRLVPLSATGLSPVGIAPHWLKAPAVHLFWKKVAWAGEFARMFANVKSIRPPEGFGVLICRESLCGPVIRPICVSACHRMPGLTLPVTGSMVCAKILPDQVLVW